MTYSIIQSTKSYFGHVLDLFCHAPSMVSQSQKTKSRVEALVVGLPFFFQVGLSPISRTYEMIAVVSWSRFFLSWVACSLTQFFCAELGIEVAPYYDKLRQQIAKTDFMYNYYKGFYSFSREQEFEFLKVCFRGDFLKGLPDEIKKSIVVHLRPPVRGEDIQELQNPKNISWQSEDNEDFSFERTI